MGGPQRIQSTTLPAWHTFAKKLAAKWHERALGIPGLKHIIIRFTMHLLVQYLLHYLHHFKNISCVSPLKCSHPFVAPASPLKQLQLCIHSEVSACHRQEWSRWLDSPTFNLRELFPSPKPFSFRCCLFVLCPEWAALRNLQEGMI